MDGAVAVWRHSLMTTELAAEAEALLDAAIAAADGLADDDDDDDDDNDDDDNDEGGDRGKGGLFDDEDLLAEAADRFARSAEGQEAAAWLDAELEELRQLKKSGGALPDWFLGGSGGGGGEEKIGGSGGRRGGEVGAAVAAVATAGGPRHVLPLHLFRAEDLSPHRGPGADPLVRPRPLGRPQSFGSPRRCCFWALPKVFLFSFRPLPSSHTLSPRTFKIHTFNIPNMPTFNIPKVHAFNLTKMHTFNIP